MVDQDAMKKREQRAAAAIAEAATSWFDTTLCGHFQAGDVFSPYSAAHHKSGTDGQERAPRRFLIHVIGGLETLAAAELAEAGCSDILPVQGKVLFGSTAPLETLRCLRSAERLSLLCWARPALPMPGEDTVSARTDVLRHVEQEVMTRAEFAPRAEFADVFAEFYGKQRPETAKWLRELERVLRMHALPALQAQEHAWRAVTGHAAGRHISFRVDVNRGGKRSRLCGVTSLLMEEVNLCVCTVSAYACSATAYPSVHGSLAANAWLLICQCIDLFIPSSTNICATAAADTFTCIRKHSKCACNLANMRPYIAAGRPVLPPPRLES